MAPYAPAGPDDAALGNPWVDVGQLQREIDRRMVAEYDRMILGDPGGESQPLTGLLTDALSPWTVDEPIPLVPACPTGRTATVNFTWQPTPALIDAFRAIGIDLPTLHAERARVARVRGRSRQVLRAMRRDAAKVRRAPAGPTRYQWARDGMKPQ